MSSVLTGQELSDAVEEVMIPGDVSPLSWNRKITDHNGNADAVAILVLARIVFWLRPSKKTGKKKYQSELLRKTYKQLSKELHLSVKQVERAVKLLEEKKILYSEIRDEEVNGTPMRSKYYGVYIENLKKITYDVQRDSRTAGSNGEDTAEGAPPNRDKADGTDLKDGGVTPFRGDIHRITKKSKKKPKKGPCCPECGNPLYWIEKEKEKEEEDTGFYGHLDWYKEDAICTKTFSAVAEIKGLKEQPDRNNSNEPIEEVDESVVSLTRDIFNSK